MKRNWPLSLYALATTLFVAIPWTAQTPTPATHLAVLPANRKMSREAALEALGR
jgi:hypothetical protein